MSFDQNQATRLIKITTLAIRLNLDKEEIRKLEKKIDACIISYVKSEYMNSNMYLRLQQCQDLLERKLIA